LTGAEEINHIQRAWAVDKIKSLVGGDLKDKTVGVWGISFKPNTDDTRESPAVFVINLLLAAGATVKAYDPVLSEMGTDEIPEQYLVKTAMEAIQKADALFVATDWDEFRGIDLDQVKKNLAQPNIIDGRNIFDKTEMEKLGLKYKGIGV
jgi:UDPglucose 6-dehydrogenase